MEFSVKGLSVAYINPFGVGKATQALYFWSPKSKGATVEKLSFAIQIPAAWLKSPVNIKTLLLYLSAIMLWMCSIFPSGNS